MIDRQFPPEFDALMRAPNVRAAFVSEVTNPNPNACPNCGGASTMYVYIATVGPFNICPDKSRLISHWADGRWWLGKGFEFPCPVCQSLTKPYKGTPSAWERNNQKVSEQIELLANELSVRDEEER